MPLQYSDQEIDDFIKKLQDDVRSNLEEHKTMIPMGFALGRLDPRGVRKRSAHIVYARPVRSYSKLLTFSDNVRTMALRAEAECAGCVVTMPALVQHTDVRKDRLLFEEGEFNGIVQETVMIHAEQLYLGHRCWYAQVQDVDGEACVTDFEELHVSPHPNRPSFLPLEMYGAATVYA